MPLLVLRLLAALLALLLDEVAGDAVQVALAVLRDPPPAARVLQGWTELQSRPISPTDKGPTFSSTPIFSRPWTTLRSMFREASTCFDGLLPRFLDPP